MRYIVMIIYQPTRPGNCISVAPEQNDPDKTNYNPARVHQQGLIAYLKQTYIKIDRGFKPHSLTSTRT